MISLPENKISRNAKDSIRRYAEYLGERHHCKVSPICSKGYTLDNIGQSIQIDVILFCKLYSPYSIDKTELLDVLALESFEF